MTPDNRYRIGITVKNTGTKVWTESDMVRLCIWQDGSDYGYRVHLLDDAAVEPDEEYTFRLEGFGAPPVGNSTVLEYQMVLEGVQYFGEREMAEVLISR